MTTRTADGKPTSELPAQGHVSLDNRVSLGHQAHVEIPLTAAVENMVCKQGWSRNISTRIGSHTSRPDQSEQGS